MMTLVSRMAFHMKGARFASICSPMSGDISAALTIRPNLCANRNW
jgi:hypothetical protein